MAFVGLALGAPRAGASESKTLSEISTKRSSFLGGQRVQRGVAARVRLPGERQPLVWVAESETTFDAEPRSPAPSPAPEAAPRPHAHGHAATGLPTGPPAVEAFRPIPAGANDQRPLLFFLPGVDGVGKSIYSQRALFAYFDVVCMRYPAESRAGWAEMVSLVGAAMRHELEHAAGEAHGRPRRRVYLFGESFGGALALLVAAAFPEVVDRVLLLNPGSSYNRMPTAALWTALPALPESVYNNLPLAMTPVLLSPREIGKDPIRTIRAFMRLPRVLPNATLGHRIRLLQDFALPEPQEIPQPLLVLASEADRLLPSPDEARRLVRHYPSAQTRALPGAGHAAMQEGSVDVLAELLAAGFLDEEGAAGLAGRAREAAGTAALRGALDIRAIFDEPEGDWAGLDPLDWTPPAPAAFERVVRLFDLQRRATSPVFVGLERLPVAEVGRRPLLFVGNHTLFGFYDLPFLWEKLFRLGIPVRGLAHPIAFAGARSRSARRSPSPPPARASPFGPPAFFPLPGLAPARPPPPPPALEEELEGDLFTALGAVPVSPRGLYRLLEARQPVLLFPGGIREALRGKATAPYALQWREEPDFVRMAARFGALIVPFASIGADDAFEVLADAEDLRRLPLVGELARLQVEDAARRGVVDAEFTIPPLGRPKLPERVYFHFGEPIDAGAYAGRLRDRDAALELYDRVRGAVEDGIAALKAGRRRDPYRKFVPRVAYEALNGRPAPSFDGAA